MNPRRLVATGATSAIILTLAFAPAGLDGCQRHEAPSSAAPHLDFGSISYPYADLGIKAGNYPKVDGSTSTQPLQMITACKIFGVGTEWSHDYDDDTRRLWPVRPDAVPFEHRIRNRSQFIHESLLCDYVQDLVHCHGTSEAYVNLINNGADLIFAARLPSDDESRLAEELGVQLDARPVALDAFVFLLNRKNPVADLKIEQIRDIYSGRIVNWSAIGGTNAPIRPYQRPRNSGSQELMQKLVMKGRRMIDAPDVLIGSEMSSTFLELDQDVQGIGYSVYYYHEFMSPPSAIKVCAVEGVLPTPETLRSRQYPFVSEVYVVVRRDLSPETSACRLRDWLLGPTGQSIVEESGYVAIREASDPSQQSHPGTVDVEAR